MLSNGAFYNEMFNNFKKIKAGTYYGQVQFVFIGENRKGEKRLHFILQYFDQEDVCIKPIMAIYNMSGTSKVYLSSQLMRVMWCYGIDIKFDMSIDELEKQSKELIGKALPFLVEQTDTNKNIRLLPPTCYMQNI